MAGAMIIGLSWLSGCVDKGVEGVSAMDQIEQSSNPGTFLAGSYQLAKLDLPSGYGEQVPNLTSHYELAVRAVGDSVHLSLSGTGKVGRFDGLSLGTFAVVPNAANLTSVSIGGRYGYALRRSTGQKSYISFTRVPFADKTEYEVLFNLYRNAYGLDPNQGQLIADESYSINPAYNERIATFRLARTSSGVWRPKQN